jgi:hypothetical protein
VRIKSADNTAWLAILHNKDEPHASYSIECAVDIGHGAFDAENNDVHFLNQEEFAKAIDAFILDRTLAPQLNGTYDTFVRFFQPSGKNGVMVRFAIGDAYSGRSAARYRTEGEFEVDAEYLNELAAGFAALFSDAG